MSCADLTLLPNGGRRSTNSRLPKCTAYVRLECPLGGPAAGHVGPPQRSRRRAALLAVFRERPALLRQLPQQRRGRPQVAVLPLKLADALVHFLEPYRVRVPHRSAAVGRKRIAV